MGFNLVINSVKNIQDTKLGFCIYAKDGKNYLKKMERSMNYQVVILV